MTLIKLGIEKVYESYDDKRPTEILENIKFTDSEGDIFIGTNKARLSVLWSYEYRGTKRKVQQLH